MLPESFIHQIDKGNTSNNVIFNPHPRLPCLQNRWNYVYRRRSCCTPASGEIFVWNPQKRYVQNKYCRLTSSDSLTGKQWHAVKSAFRPKAGNGTYEKRNAERVAMNVVKAKEKEMKEEKEAERQVSDTPARERTAFRTKC